MATRLKSGITKWNGKIITAKAVAAAKEAIDSVTTDAVAHAKANHEWENVTGTAEGSIQMRPARQSLRGIRGEFGSYGINYFVFLELGTVHMQAMPSLRPAADIYFPQLAQRIRERMMKMGLTL